MLFFFECCNFVYFYIFNILALLTHERNNWCYFGEGLKDHNNIQPQSGGFQRLLYTFDFWINFSSVLFNVYIV